MPIDLNATSNFDPDAQPVAPLAYMSTVPSKPGTRVWAAATIVISGLGLIFLGGCFLIGVLLMVSNTGFNNSPPVIHPAGYVLLVLLHVLAILCFIGAVVLIVRGVAALLRISKQ